MEIFLTIISAVTIFVIGQIVQEFVLKPIANYKIRIADISHKVKFQSNKLSSSVFKEEILNQAQADMRDLSSGLESAYLSIPFVDFFSKIKVVPSRKNVQIAAKNLIQLSNAGGIKEWEIKNAEAIDEIKNSLNIVLEK